MAIYLDRVNDKYLFELSNENGHKVHLDRKYSPDYQVQRRGRQWQVSGDIRQSSLGQSSQLRSGRCEYHSPAFSSPQTAPRDGPTHYSL